MRASTALAVWLAAATPLMAQDAHVHGHGTLDIAIEGSSLMLMLEVPGADLHGFEGAPSSAEEITAEERTRQLLSDPLMLLGAPPEAECTVAGMETSLDAEDDGHDRGHDHGHSDITAHYDLRCSNLAAWPRLDLSHYFSTFPGSESLDARIAGANGAIQGTLLAPSPIIDLTTGN